MENCVRCGRQLVPQAVPLWVIKGTPPAVIGKAHSSCCTWKDGPAFDCREYTKEKALAEYQAWQAKMSVRRAFFHFRVETSRGRIYFDVEAENGQGAVEARERIRQFLNNPKRGGATLALREIFPLKEASTIDARAQVILLNGREHANGSAWRALGLSVQYDVAVA